MHTSSLINLNKEPIDRKNLVSNILIYFKNNFKNKDILSINLLTNEDIKKLNTFLIPGYNMGNYIAISKYFNIIDNNNFKDNFNINDVGDLEDDSSSSFKFSENEDEGNNVNNDSISNNENLFDKLSDDKDFTYNLSKFINSIDLDIIKNQDNIK